MMKWHAFVSRGRVSPRRGIMLLLTALLTSAGSGTVATAAGEGPSREGGWLKERDEQTGIVVHTMEMTLHPQAEPRPALKYRILPDEFDMLDGNAAVHYLKALGFLEQSAAHQQLREFRRSAAKERRPITDFPPYVWQSMTPQELPLDEVKDFLRLTEFQRPMVAQAARRRRFDMERNIRDVEDPIGYLLSEVTEMRELARMQSLRCKVAIAGGHIDEALAILGEQYAMARHLGQDDFLISNLVGLACAGTAWDDALQLVQHPDAPNLYWAFTSMPRPLIDMRSAMGIERQFLYLQLKLLREVDETPRPPGFWQDFLDRFASKLGGHFAAEARIPVSDDPQTTRALLVGFVAAAYPGAKRYLIEEQDMTREQVEAYPIAQAVFLAVVRYYDEVRDEYFKWLHVPYHHARLRAAEADEMVQQRARRIGWSAMPAQFFVWPAVLTARPTAARLEQQLALIQTVEAIRMYGAAHGGRLPSSLEDLPVAAPLEPVTGAPVEYEHHGDHAVLQGHDMPALRYRLVLHFASDAERQPDPQREGVER